MGAVPGILPETVRDAGEPGMKLERILLSLLLLFTLTGPGSVQAQLSTTSAVGSAGELFRRFFSNRPKNITTTFLAARVYSISSIR